MADYASAAQVGARLGWSITSSSRPNLTQMASVLADCTSIINGFMQVTSNVTDSAGFLRVVAINLACKMVNNIFAMAEPEKFAYMEVALTPDDERLIRKALRKWAATAWRMGE